MTIASLRGLILAIGLFCIIAMFVSAEPDPPGHSFFCPGALPVPQFTLGHGEAATSVTPSGNTATGIQYPIIIVNSAEYRDSTFSCERGSCLLYQSILFEDGTVANSGGVRSRDELGGSGVFIESGTSHTGVRLTLNSPYCNLSVQSVLIPIPSDGHPGSHYPSDCVDIPSPRIRYVGSEEFSTDAGMFTRYKITVENYADYNSSLFFSAPDLPACGSNTASSRTWVSIFNQVGAYIYGYCAQTSPGDLADMSFSIHQSETPPSSVFIRINDRRCGAEPRSNDIEIPAGTVHSPPGGNESGHSEPGLTTCPSFPGSLEMDTDRFGGDYRSFDLSSADPCECARQCVDDVSCRAFTYGPPDALGSAAKCWLKNSIPISAPGTGLISGVISARTTPGSDPSTRRLRAPFQISPPNSSVLSTYPRNLYLRWQSVPGATSYSTEVDCYHCCVINRWCSDIGRQWILQTGIIGTTGNAIFSGKQKGRWRVWAVDASGNEGEKSPWWEFEYTV